MLNKMNMMSAPPSFESDSILNRMQNAMLLQDQRCSELTLLFDRATKQDLQTIFPILVDNIFGPHGTFHWNLRKINAETSSTEFTNVLNFLKPQGPMFKLIYTLLQDVTIKYDFSLAYLPTKVRQMLEGSNVNPFYNEIIQYTNHQSGRQLMSLLLNPFDYYIFHFVYHLINPCHQRVQSEEIWNTVYYNLCAEYLLHFFPTTLGTQILPVINFYHGKNPIQSTQHVFKPYKQSSLLKQNLFGDPQVNDMKVMHQHIEKHPRNEIWRSETILMAIIDLLLSNDQVCSQFNNLCGGTYPELPSGDYIRIIRMVVKHLHAFASTAKNDNSSLGELKKHTFPMMQSRMYVFLRNLLHRWPLDESFRLVLELWLSFIQPWRYAYDGFTTGTGINKLLPTTSGNPQPEKNAKHADENYLHFIAENLLVYIVILQQLLPRFARIDLASPKNAQMLFRLTKVFNQPNLVHMLKKVESLVENKNYSPTHHSTLNYSSILPPLSPTSRWSTNTTTDIYSSTHNMQDLGDGIHPANFFGSNYETFASKYMNLVRQKIYELEGPNFCYKPMFTSQTALEVYELLKLTKASEIKAVALLEECKKSQKNEASFWNLLFGAPQNQDEISLQDRLKAPVFLKSSAEFLIDTFHIKDFNNFDVTPERVHEMSRDDSSRPDTSYATICTPTKVKERLKNMKYEGDPDLTPIRSYEIAFLVRLLYCLASNINQQYGPLLSQWYYNSDFQGRFMSNFIQDPMQVFRFEKSFGTSRRVMYHLPPRVSFRKLSNRSFLLFLGVGTLFSIWLQLGWWSFILGYFAANMLVALFRATFHTRVVPTLDLNFNDSLEE